MSKEPSFSMHEFRSWLAKHNAPEKLHKKKEEIVDESIVGKTVDSRLGIERLEQKIAEENKTDIADVLAEDFKSNGGVVKSTNELCVVVEVKSGEFTLPRLYTKVRTK